VLNVSNQLHDEQGDWLNQVKVRTMTWREVQGIFLVHSVPNKCATL